MCVGPIQAMGFFSVPVFSFFLPWLQDCPGMFLAQVRESQRPRGGEGVASLIPGGG